MNGIIGQLILMSMYSVRKDISWHTACYIIEHIHSIKDMSIRELAEACAISTASAAKFTRLFDVSSFTEFKEQLERSLYVRETQIRSRCASMDLDETKKNMTFLFPEMRWDEFLSSLKSAVSLIHEHPRTVLTGALFPLSLSAEFCEDMCVFGRPVLVSQMVSDTVNTDDFRQNDLLFIITITGRIFRLYPGNYSLFKETDRDILVLSQLDMRAYTEHFIQVPGREDHEKYNVFLLDVFTLLKYLYAKTYMHM